MHKRLIDQGKVDLVIGGHGTNARLPATPSVRERQRFHGGLMGLGVDNALVCPSRCAVIPAGPDPNAALTEGFFELAARQNPRSTTAALVSVDAEFFRNPVLGAKANAGKRGTEVVHESTSPLPTGDFKTVVDAVTEAGGSLFRIERAGEKPAPHDARCSGKSLSRRHADVR